MTQRLVSIGLDLPHAQHALNGTAAPEVDRTLDGAVAELTNAGVRVIVVEDQTLLRDWLAPFFTDKDHHVVGSAGDTNSHGELVAATGPELVVLDLRMPPTFTHEGATTAPSLKTDRPELGIRVHSQHIDKSSDVDLVAQPGFGHLLNKPGHRSRRVPRRLRLRAEGLTNSGIASRLLLSPRTVEAHVGNLMTTLTSPTPMNVTGEYSRCSPTYAQPAETARRSPQDRSHR